LGSSIKDTATVSGGSSPTGTVTFKLYDNSSCSGAAVFSDTESLSNGSSTSGSFTPSSAGSYYWIATYNGDANNQPVSGNCGDQGEISVVNSPGIKVVKLDSVPCADLAPGVTQPSDVSCAGKFTTFTHNIVTLEVPRTGSYSIPVDYQIRVTDTGQTTLDLPTAAQLNDPMCDAGTVVGPTANAGTLSFSSRTGQDTVLSVGGEALYTCSHTLTRNDASSQAGDPFTNTVSVTAYPPSGPPVHGSDLVTVHRTQPPPPQPFCIARRGKHKGHKVNWPEGTPKPKACRPPHHHPSKPPKHPGGFTG
jgi:hypothetical protein